MPPGAQGLCAVLFVRGRGEPRRPGQRRARRATRRASLTSAPRRAAYGSRVERLRQLCRAATIPIPPNAYRAAKAGGGEAALETALEALLAKHGLSRSSDRAATDAARARLQLQKDLDGAPLRPLAGRVGRSLWVGHCG